MKHRFITAIVQVQRNFRLTRFVRRRIAQVMKRKEKACRVISRYVRGWLVRKNLKKFMHEKIDCQLEWFYSRRESVIVKLLDDRIRRQLVAKRERKRQ